MSETVGVTVRMTGRLEIPKACKPYHSPGNWKTIDGFTLPDGRIVRAIMMFEIEDSTGNITEPSCMELENVGILGAGDIDHRDVVFTENYHA